LKSTADQDAIHYRFMRAFERGKPADVCQQAIPNGDASAELIPQLWKCVVVNRQTNLLALLPTLADQRRPSTAYEVLRRRRQADP
jgi:hypothetical protein